MSCAFQAGAMTGYDEERTAVGPAAPCRRPLVGPGMRQKASRRRAIEPLRSSRAPSATPPRRSVGHPAALEVARDLTPRPPWSPPQRVWCCGG
jgi:hypothetical protein